MIWFSFSSILVPTEYFNHLDHSGRRVDWYQRPELCLGSYEILATKQYCKVWDFFSSNSSVSLIFFLEDEKWPESPAFIFMIDVSYNSVRSGLVEYICHILKNDLLDYLPKFVD
jgi:protein transport protein SEC24